MEALWNELEYVGSIVSAILSGPIMRNNCSLFHPTQPRPAPAPLADVALILND